LLGICRAFARAREPPTVHDNAEENDEEVACGWCNGGGRGGVRSAGARLRRRLDGAEPRRDAEGEDGARASLRGGASRHAVGTPAPGRTYYGLYSGTRYAVATFGSNPTIFETDRHGRWHVRRDTHGAICDQYVPLDLLMGHWWLQRYDDHCFVEPA